MKKNITKLLTGSINEEELIALRNWLNKPGNQSILESYVRDYHDLNLATLKDNVDDAYNRVVHQIDTNKKPVKKLFPIWTKYAAAILLLFGLGFLFQQDLFSGHEQNILMPGEESITLELDNGTIQIIDINGAKKVVDPEGNIIGDQNQNEITYSDATQKEELVFNTLKIPNGKKFKLQLSDGTTVLLNAGSSLRYPVTFLREGPRQVFLTGEAYFDVTTNESKPFIVNVNKLDVKVLGTEFNVSAYAEDASIDVVLVEGAVNLIDNVDSHSQPIKLSPGEKGSFENHFRNINVSQVNTSLYTSWMQDYLVFRDVTFNNILRKLERHYNVEIVNDNTELGKEIFNARFEKVDIEEVLEYFNDIHKINYKIKENRVIIK